MPKPRWTIRNLKKWGNYAKKCMLRASSRRFERQMAREEGKNTVTEHYTNTVRSGKKMTALMKQGKLPKLEKEVIVRIVVDTGLKNAWAKEGFSAKEYSALTKIARKYLRAGMNRHEKARVQFLEELLELCGPKRAERVINEIENARNVVSAWKE